VKFDTNFPTVILLPVINRLNKFYREQYRSFKKTINFEIHDKFFLCKIFFDSTVKIQKMKIRYGLIVSKY